MTSLWSITGASSTVASPWPSRSPWRWRVTRRRRYPAPTRWTSVASFKIVIAAFIAAFMFFYNSALLMDGTWFEVGAMAIFGVFHLWSGIQR